LTVPTSHFKTEAISSYLKSKKPAHHQHLALFRRQFRQRAMQQSGFLFVLVLPVRRRCRAGEFLHILRQGHLTLAAPRVIHIALRPTWYIQARKDVPPLVRVRYLRIRKNTSCTRSSCRPVGRQVQE